LENLRRLEESRKTRQDPKAPWPWDARSSKQQTADETVAPPSEASPSAEATVTPQPALERTRPPATAEPPAREIEQPAKRNDIHPNTSGGKTGGNGGGDGGGGGGRKDGGSPPLEQRSADKEFREVLGKGLASCRRNLITVGLFSIAVNLLVLSIPVYLFNI